MIRWLTMLGSVAFVSGCWLTENELGDKIDGVVDTDTDEPGPIEIEDVDPEFGTSAGGTDVTILAFPVGEDIVVRFGGSEAAVLDVTTDTVTVRTPGGSPGPVDVSMEWGQKTGSVADAFEYFPDASDEYGAIGSLSWYDVVGVLEGQISDQGFAWMSLIDPQPYHWGAFYGTSLDTCASGWTYPGTLTEVSGASQVMLSRAEGGLALAWDPTDDRFEADLVPEGSRGNEWAQDTTWDLDEVSGGAGWPPIAVKGLVATPNAFEVFHPFSADDNSDQFVFTQQIQIQWTTPGRGDYTVIRLYLYSDEVFPVLQEVVSCRVEDDGVFVVPFSVWQTEISSHIVDIYVGRAAQADARLPHDASMSGVAGVYWNVGTVIYLPF